MMRLSGWAQLWVVATVIWWTYLELSVPWNGRYVLYGLILAAFFPAVGLVWVWVLQWVRGRGHKR